jgi:hypothetical protein
MNNGRQATNAKRSKHPFRKFCPFLNTSCSIFDFQILAREGLELLSETNEIVLTRHVADQYFPAAKGQYDQIIGEQIELNNDPDPYRIVIRMAWSTKWDAPPVEALSGPY